MSDGRAAVTEENLRSETVVELSLDDGFRPTGALARLAEGFSPQDGEVVLYGPYTNIPAGTFTVTFFGTFRPGSDPSFCDVCADVGSTILGRTELAPGSGEIARLTFLAESACSNVEFRCYAAANSYIKIDRVRLTRTEEGPSLLLSGSAGSEERRFDIYDRIGLRLVLDPSSLVDKIIIEAHTLEGKQLHLMERLATQLHNGSTPMVFLDVGAYFGLYAIAMLRTGLFDTIVAFEADALNYRQLQANLLLNDPDLRIETHNVAVSDRDGETAFFPSWNHPTKNRGGVGMLGGPLDVEGGVRVATRALDRLVPIWDSILFTKIDVEGSELQVLTGMQRLLTDNRCVVQEEALEDSPTSIEKNEEVRQFLLSIGFYFMGTIGHDRYYTNIPDLSM